MSRPLILVTGASDGIGLETAKTLAQGGADVIVHGRSAPRVQAAHAAVERAAGRTMPKSVLGDFSSLSGVLKLARTLDEEKLRPTVLLNNAGVFMKKLEKSVDGVEMTMAVNHFAPFLLTQLLLEQEGQRIERIVNVSSMAHARGQLSLDDIRLLDHRFDPYRNYSASKLANVVFTVELARRLGPKPTVNALHPGVVSTKLLTEGFGFQGNDTLAESAATSVFLALDPSVGGVTGEYFSSKKRASFSPVAKDQAFTKRFFELSSDLVRASLLKPH